MSGDPFNPAFPRIQLAYPMAGNSQDALAFILGQPQAGSDPSAFLYQTPDMTDFSGGLPATGQSALYDPSQMMALYQPGVTTNSGSPTYTSAQGQMPPVQVPQGQAPATQIPPQTTQSPPQTSMNPFYNLSDADISSLPGVTATMLTSMGDIPSTAGTTAPPAGQSQEDALIAQIHQYLPAMSLDDIKKSLISVTIPPPAASTNNSSGTTSSGGVTGPVSNATVDQIRQEIVQKALSYKGWTNQNHDIQAEFAPGGLNSEGWCAQFAVTPFRKLFGETAPWPGGSWDQNMVYGDHAVPYRPNGSRPVAGDIVQFHGYQGSGSLHVGIVTKVYSDGSFDTIEGGVWYGKQSDRNSGVFTSHYSADALNHVNFQDLASVVAQKMKQ